MRVGIDASNLRAGGGVTHLVELLGAADPAAHRFSEIIVWGGGRTLARVADRPWIRKCALPVLEKDLVHRIYWQRYALGGLLREANCDVLFAPGGSYTSSFRPGVAMSQNMQPFELRELKRHGVSPMAARLLLLRWAQTHSLRRADGVIFLTRYAEREVMRVVGHLRRDAVVIPHGLDPAFLQAPRVQLPIESYSADKPLRVVYVSIVNVYKHQWHVAEAIARLRSAGMPVALDLVGPAVPASLRRLQRCLAELDPDQQFIRYVGPVEHASLPALYRGAALCLFASSCENLPIILLEGMASGLPVACSDRGPMPEVLGDAGVYFDPENPVSIAAAVRSLVESAQLRARMAQASFARAQRYSWPRCAADTFAFLARIAAEHRGLVPTEPTGA